MQRDTKTRLLAAAVGLSAFVAAPAAFAAPCPALPNPIYGSGGSAATATIGRVAAALRGLPGDQAITIFYHDPGACFGFDYFVNYVRAGADVIDTTPQPTQVKYWDADGTQRTCDPPSDANPIPLDFSHMGNQSDYCAGHEDGLPTFPAPNDEGYEFRDFLTPIQTLNLITAKDSTQNSISAEALYHIFGLGAAAADIAPWNDPSRIVLRNTGSFVHQFLADTLFGATLGRQAAFERRFFDHPEAGAGRLGLGVQANNASIVGVTTLGATNPSATLGYVSGNAADAPAVAPNIKTLAYQHYGQSCGYWPSSNGQSVGDKINVRQGLYHLWTPGHLYARTDADGNFVVTRGADATENEAIADRVRRFFGYYTNELESPEGVTPPILERIIIAGDVPACAMQVAREGTLGAVRSEAPAEPCGCYFEAVATGNAGACRACSATSPCSGTDVCRFGYCEAQ